MSDRRRYKILDTATQRWWMTFTGREVWTGVDTAMAAWNNERSIEGVHQVFSRQNRFQVRAFQIEAV